MSAKFVVLASLVAIASAGVPYAPAYTPSAAPAYAMATPEPYNDHPQYNFAYEVHDDHTGDIKSQQESRDGDVVKGYYTFIEADGSRRIVEYTADDHSGFNAVVHREAGVAKPAPVYNKAAAPAHQGYYH